MFALAGVTVGVSAVRVAAGPVATGTQLGIDEFLLVQWLAPLASEAPELLVGLFAAQFVAGGVLRAGLHSAAAGEIELYAALYLLLTAAYLCTGRALIAQRLRALR